MSLPGTIYWIEEILLVLVWGIGRAHRWLQSVWLVLVGIREIETRLWLKHRVVERLCKGIVRMCAARREVVTHFREGRETVSRTVYDVLDTVGVMMRTGAARGRLVLGRSVFCVVSAEYWTLTGSSIGLV